MSRFLNKNLFDLEAYAPGEQPKDLKYIKLNTNESPYPPSQSVLDAIDKPKIDNLRLYPDTMGTELTKSISEYYKISPENIILGNGSDEILSYFFMTFCSKTNSVVFPDITYGFYKVFGDLYGVDYTEIPLKDDFTIDTDVYNNINKNIIIANPNAPTGISLSIGEIEKILSSNKNNIVLIDEAYVDFGSESCIGLINKYDNLLVVQTFSKSRSLAGARLGFGVASKEIISDMNKVKFSTNPYNINRLTLDIGKKSIEDKEYFKKCCQQIIETRNYILVNLKALGFSFTESKANFIFAKHNSVNGKTLYTKLREKGILVRHFDKEKINDYLRITIGTQEQMQQLIKALKAILEELKV